MKGTYVVFCNNGKCGKKLGKVVNGRYRIPTGCIQVGTGRNKPLLTYCSRKCEKQADALDKLIITEEKEGGSETNQDAIFKKTVEAIRELRGIMTEHSRRLSAVEDRLDAAETAIANEKMCKNFEI